MGTIFRWFILAGGFSIFLVRASVVYTKPKKYIEDYILGKNITHRHSTAVEVIYQVDRPTGYLTWKAKRLSIYPFA